MIITAYSAGAAIGPLVGGAVLQVFWWGAAFLVAVPVMVLLLILGPILLPEYRDPSAGRPDLPSAGLATTAVLAVIFGLKQIAQDGVGPLPVGAIAAGLALAVLFVRRPRRLTDPLIDLALFRTPAFSAALTTYAFVTFLLTGGFLFLPQYMQLVLGLSPLEAGLASVPWALAFVVGSMLTPRIAPRLRAAHLMAGGMLLAAVGFAMLARADATTGVVTVVLGTVLFALGTSPVFPLTNAIILGSAAPERAGAASGMSETSAEVGGALGIAIFGSLGIAAYRGVIDLPPGVPPEAAAAARDTLGAAVAVAAQLPGPLGTAVVDVARDAFILGLQVAILASAIGCLTLAVFILLTLHGVGASPADASPVREPDVAPAA